MNFSWSSLMSRLSLFSLFCSQGVSCCFSKHLFVVLRFTRRLFCDDLAFYLVVDDHLLFFITYVCLGGRLLLEFDNSKIVPMRVIQNNNNSVLAVIELIWLCVITNSCPFSSFKDWFYRYCEFPLGYFTKCILVVLNRRCFEVTCRSNLANLLCLS